jgi:hypothetical protein
MKRLTSLTQKSAATFGMALHLLSIDDAGGFSPGVNFIICH